MNKIAAFFSVLTLAGVAFGAANDTVISFSTPGIDSYADGSRVLPGESYALVWTAKGSTFGGLSADCQPISENDKLVMVAPLAKRGRCPVTVVEIDANDAKQYENGTFSLYLLDTRTKGANGVVALASYVNGLPQVVNSVGATDATKDFAAVDGVAGQINAGAAVKLGAVGVYTQVDAPQITAIEIKGAQIRIRVKGMSDVANYFVVPGNAPGNFAPAMDATPDAEGFTFEKPEDQDATFFKVIGVRKFE